jgi:Spy/CpxP family protein refolding chaperone
MKKLLIWVLLMLPAMSWAQPGQGPGHGRGQGPQIERMKAMKIGFITRELSLTEEEAQKFWPVYNKYEESREEHRKKMMRLRLQSDADADTLLTTKEAEQLVQQYLQLRQEEVEMEKQYYQSLKKVLPAEKIARLFMAEKRFQREVLRNMQQRREQPFRGPRER